MISQAVAPRAGSEDGGVLVLVALWLPVLILFVILVVDVGNWFVHKRHLQMQADAGALAGAGSFTFPCADDPIVTHARTYSGDPGAAAPYNLQIPPTDQASVHVLVNSSAYWNEGGTDYSDGGPPCSARMVDVKITEANLPWYFQLANVPAINAHARVEIQALSRSAGALPVAAPDIDPRVARAYFVNEATGAVIASAPLTKTGTSNGLAVWDNASTPLAVPIGAAQIGVRIALGGGSSTTCGEILVACYDAESSAGILYVRGYSTSGSAQPPNQPLARDVRLFSPGSNPCAGAYFSRPTTSCNVGIAATVDVGTFNRANVQIKAFGGLCGNGGCSLAYDASLAKWTGAVPVAAAAGPVPIELRWQLINTTITGKGTCSTSFRNNNPCQGSFGTVQRTFTGTDARSGPIRIAEVWENGASGANSFPTGTTRNLVVKIAIAGNLADAQSVSDPVVLLRVTGSQNQSVDCDPDLPNLRDEIRYGCRPLYEVNGGTACPSAASALWGTPQPWNCVAIQTGGAVGQVEQGLRDRILGGSPTCTSPNNWSSFPNIPSGDPRIVPVFITPFGTFTGSGNDVVPVTNFATFYVTGWFNSPCANDDPAPDRGYIVGHFIKYVFALNSGGGSGELCDVNAFGSCVAAMTE